MRAISFFLLYVCLAAVPSYGAAIHIINNTPELGTVSPVGDILVPDGGSTVISLSASPGCLIASFIITCVPLEVFPDPLPFNLSDSRYDDFYNISDLQPYGIFRFNSTVKYSIEAEYNLSVGSSDIIITVSFSRYYRAYGTILPKDNYLSVFASPPMSDSVICVWNINEDGSFYVILPPGEYEMSCYGGKGCKVSYKITPDLVVIIDTNIEVATNRVVGSGGRPVGCMVSNNKNSLFLFLIPCAIFIGRTMKILLFYNKY